MLVVGAGLSGLACARTLRDAGLTVMVVDKGLSPGGRTAMRRLGPFTLDHGAQYFTAREDDFARTVSEWEAAGVVAPWPAAGAGRYVGVPSMSAIACHLAATLDVRLGVRVDRVERVDRVDGREARRGAFGAAPIAAHTHDGQVLTASALVSSLPAPQACALFAHVDEIAGPLARVQMDPCWAVCVAFASPVRGDTEVVRGAGALGWACRDGHKPGREASDAHAETWMLHGTPAFSVEMLEADGDAVIATLLGALARTVGPLPPVARSYAHRWRYARVREPLGTGALVSRPVDTSAPSGRGAPIVACGDFAYGSRLEDAYRSGVEAAHALLAARPS